MSDRYVRYPIGSLHPDTDRAVRFAAWAFAALCTVTTVVVVLFVTTWVSVHVLS